MCHRPAKPGVPVQPESAVHCVDHAIATVRELPPWRRPADVGLAHAACCYWQPINPSIVAGASGETLPANIAQVSGYDAGCVARADHPDAVAATMSIVTPGEVVKLRRVLSAV